MAAVSPRTPAMDEKAASGPFLRWKDSFSVGIKALDDDHRLMVQLINAACIARHDGGRTEALRVHERSEEHTSELQSLMRTSYAVFCLKKKNTKNNKQHRLKDTIESR